MTVLFRTSDFLFQTQDCDHLTMKTYPLTVAEEVNFYTKGKMSNISLLPLAKHKDVLHLVAD